MASEATQIPKGSLFNLYIQNGVLNVPNSDDLEYNGPIAIPHINNSKILFVVQFT